MQRADQMTFEACLNQLISHDKEDNPMIKCPSCGSETSDDNKFCSYCGALLADGNNSDKTDDGQEGQENPQENTPVLDPPGSPVSSNESTEDNKQDHSAPTNAVPIVNTPKPKAAESNDPLCLWGFIVSIISIVACGYPSIISLVLSIIGFFNVKKSGRKGKTLAISGIALSSIGLVILLIFSIVRGVSKNNDRKGDTDPAAVETTEVENIIVGISSADAIGKNFSEIESQLRDAGFTNIEIQKLYSFKIRLLLTYNF